MKEIIPDLDKLFKDAVDQHHELPSDKVWDAIEHNLDKKRVVNITKRYDQLKKIAVIMLLLLSTVTAYLILKPDNKIILVNNSNVKLKDINAIPNIKTNADSNFIYSNSNNKMNNVENSFANKNRNEEKNIKDLNSEPRESASSSNSNKSLSAMDQAFKSGNSIINKNNRISKEGNFNNKIRLGNRVNLQIRQPWVNEEFLGRKNNTIFNDDKVIANGKNHLFLNFIPPFSGSFIENDYLKNFQQIKSSFEPIPSVNNSKNLAASTSIKSLISKLIPRFNLTGFYSPDLNFSHLKDDKPHGPDGDRHHIKDNEKHSFSYTSGVTLGINLNKHFSIQSGLAFSQSTIENDPKNITAERDQHGDVKYRFDASCGFGYFIPKNGPTPNVGDTLRGVSSKNNLQYVQVPLIVKYTVQKGKIAFTSLAGLSLNTLISGTINTSVNNPVNPGIKETQTISSVGGLKKYALSGLIGAGLEYNLTPSIGLSFIPTGRIAFTSINSGSAVKSYPNTVGLSSGVKIRF